MPVAPKAKKKNDELLTTPINVVVLGSGGREHALVRKIAMSPLCAKVICMPGNPGMLKDSSVKVRSKISISSADFKDFEALVGKLRDLDPELIVIGPDDLLAQGFADDLQKEGFLVFGPSKIASKIEWSKAFAKEILEQAQVPTAKHAVLNSENQQDFAKVVADLGGYPIVLKYDGLALGKGVRICADPYEVEGFLKEVFESEKFSREGQKQKPTVLVEQFLTGFEVSLFALTDGEDYAVLAPACDHKRLFEGNIGPNTGGMGAYSPVPWLPPDQVNDMAEKIFPPVLAKMREAKAKFKGLLYAGLMIRGREFWVLEFNARFGDPETQAILPRLDSDLLPILYGIANGMLARNIEANPMRWSERACVNIVAASKGYPEKPETGFPISGLPGSSESEDIQIYFAGVKKGEEGLVTGGGRVFGVSALGEDLESARERAVAAIAKIKFEGMHYRKDVGRVRPGY